MFKILLKMSGLFGVQKKQFSRALEERISNMLVLVYHDVEKDLFQEHMEFLARNFDFASIDDLVGHIKSKEVPSELKVVVTFDDGLMTFYNNGFPIIEEMGIPVIVYTTTGLINSEFWLNRKLNSLVLAGQPKSTNRKITAPKSRADALRLGYFVKRGLTSEQLIEINRSHHVTIGAHSHTHAILPMLESEECILELEKSKMKLEALLKQEVKHFAYPNGDYDERVKKIVRDLGYDSAAAVMDRWVDDAADRFCFPRKGTGPPISNVSWLMYRIAK